MYILIDNENVLITMSKDVTEDSTEQGVVWMDGAGYGLFGQQVLEIENLPEYVVPDKYKYVNGTFVLNESYVSPNKEEQRITDLEIAMAQILGGAL